MSGALHSAGEGEPARMDELRRDAARLFGSASFITGAAIPVDGGWTAQ